MAKPIVVMYIPRDGYFGVRAEEPSMEIMRILNGNYGEESDEVGKKYPLYWTDYYWLVFPKDDVEAPVLEVFYEKDFTPIKFEELKKFIEDTLKAQRTDEGNQ